MQRSSSPSAGCRMGARSCSQWCPATASSPRAANGA